MTLRRPDRGATARPEAVTVRVTCTLCGYSRLEILHVAGAINALRVGLPMADCSRCASQAVVLTSPSVTPRVSPRQLSLFKS